MKRPAHHHQATAASVAQPLPVVVLMLLASGRAILERPAEQDLLARDRNDPVRIARLRHASEVADDYVLWWRAGVAGDRRDPARPMLESAGRQYF